MIRAGAIAAGAAALIGAAPIASANDVELLASWWTGMHDSTEQVVFSEIEWPHARESGESLRVRTLVVPVELPWIGEHVLYLEEFRHDDPHDIRRQLVLRLESGPRGGVTVRQYTFRDPVRFRHLHRLPMLRAGLDADDLQSQSACDLLLSRELMQFSGGTQGNACRENGAGPARYIDYRLVVGQGLYWYRKRRIRVDDNRPVEEIAGYTHFALHDARLYACRTRWQPDDGSARRDLLVADLHDQGGGASFTTPDGRRLRLELHGDDWPYSSAHDALILIVRDEATATPLASAWARLDANEISVEAGEIRARCAAIVPERHDLAS